jgi:hypothetical protein
MGATEFFTYAEGINVKAAFVAAKQEAEYESGNSGYTGTIAEKDDFKSASENVFPDKYAADDFAYQKINDDNHWCNDKYKPAAYIRFMNGNKIEYLFFGIAKT